MSLLLVYFVFLWMKYICQYLLVTGKAVIRSRGFVSNVIDLDGSSNAGDSYKWEAKYKMFVTFLNN